MRPKGPALLLSLVAALAGCIAGPRPVSETQLRSLSRHSYATPYDEAFDATWLSLERLGYLVASPDRRVGTFLARHPSGREYAVEVEQRDAQNVVTAIPGPARAAWQLDGPDGELARWERLQRMTGAILGAWRQSPEWAFLPGSNDLRVLSFRVQVPLEWEHIDLEVSRRRVELQRHKPGTAGLNPTLLLEVERRRPRHAHNPLLLDAAGRALGARTRLSLPEELEAPLTAKGWSGEADLVDGPVTRGVHWYLWDMRTPEWTIRIAAICGPEGSALSCESEWEKLVASISSRGFEFPH